MTNKNHPGMPTTIHSSELSPVNSITSLAQASMFWRPVFLAQSEWLEHIPFAFWLIEAQKPSTVVEVGTEDGASYFAICQAVDRLHLETNCYAVGSWGGSYDSTNGAKDTYLSVKNHNESHYSSFSRLIKSTSEQVIDHFADHSIDLIHFDGLNGYDAASRLIKSWMPKLSDKGLILIHDTNVREKRLRVHQLFESLKSHFPAFEFSHGQGLGVLGVGEKQPELIQLLFDDVTGRNSSQVIQDVFSRLGRACADSYSARISEQTTNELTREAEKLKAELKSVESSLSDTCQKLNEKNSEIDNLQQLIQQRVETHALERGQLVERSSMIQNLYEDLKVGAAKLQQTVDEANSKLSQQNKELHQFLGKNAAHEKQLYTNKDEKNKLTQMLSEKDREIALIKQQLEETRKQLINEIENTRAQLEASQEDAKIARKILGETTDQYQADSNKQLAALETSQEERNTARKDLEKASEQYEREREHLLAQLDALKKEAKTTRTDLKETSEQHERELENLRAELEASQDTLRKEQQNLEEIILKKESELGLRLEDKNATIESLREEMSSKNESVATRFREIATLTKLLESKEKEHQTRVESIVREKNRELVLLRAQLAISRKSKKAKLIGRMETGNQIQLIRDSNLFDAKWYLANNPDVESSKKFKNNPIRHYILFGGFEGRDPSEKFDSTWYLEQNTDVLEDCVNPLVHFILYGQSEGRLPKPTADQT